MNYIMNPVVGLVDGYWVSKMGDSTQLAGQASSEQLFNLYYTFVRAIVGLYNLGVQ